MEPEFTAMAAWVIQLNAIVEAQPGKQQLYKQFQNEIDNYGWILYDSIPQPVKVSYCDAAEHGTDDS